MVIYEKSLLVLSYIHLISILSVELCKPKLKAGL